MYMHKVASLKTITNIYYSLFRYLELCRAMHSLEQLSWLRNEAGSWLHGVLLVIQKLCSKIWRESLRTTATQRVRGTIFLLVLGPSAVHGFAIGN